MDRPVLVYCTDGINVEVQPVDLTNDESIISIKDINMTKTIS